ncbi:uncharacterized protein LOC114523774 [Dendronephthya gigantea]|uniref:uncharacterized protein LOC114523774 n=1 Tax=Dendronephthya gigantea TaxID=151771 RepID=UPI00106AC237|nr:uncharacterized protein LOC114523774 [Dendronephthya gigantea]
MVRPEYLTGLFYAMVVQPPVLVSCCGDIYQLDGYEPAVEVVSIYGDNFDTPKGREPFFIETHRCVSKGFTDVDEWPLPDTQNEIEIVVADLNDAKKFYKYVVFNHTSCKSGFKKPILHKTLKSNQINRTEFEKKLPNNPVNLRSLTGSFCDKPQPRYRVHPHGENVKPCEKLIPFKQCLPGCYVTRNHLILKIKMISEKEAKVEYFNDTACSPHTKQPTTPPCSGNRNTSLKKQGTKSSRKADQSSLSTNEIYDSGLATESE